MLHVQILKENYFFHKGYEVKIKCKPFFKESSENGHLIYKYSTESFSPCWFDNLEFFNLFKDNFEVISGEWYGKEGRWETRKKIVQGICFSNVFDYKEVNKDGNENLKIVKKKFSKLLHVSAPLNNEKNIVFKCTSAGFTDFYNLALYDKFFDEFVNMTYCFDGKKFIGNLDSFTMPLF